MSQGTDISFHQVPFLSGWMGKEKTSLGLDSVAIFPSGTIMLLLRLRKIFQLCQIRKPDLIVIIKTLEKDCKMTRKIGNSQI